MPNTAFIKNFMAHYSYPECAVSTFNRVLDRLDAEPSFAKKTDELVTEYMFPSAHGLDDVLAKVKKLADEYSENEYTMNFIFLLSCLPELKNRYEQRNLPDELFYATMDDLRCKLIECIECEQVPGTFVPGWYHGFFALTRFAYGRFQYEIRIYDFEFDFVTKCGKVIRKGDAYINFHIPSSGIPLTDDVRLDSYKKAYAAYKHLFPDGKMVFGCGSWLLYPRHREFLPKELNILRFMDDFEIVCWEEQDEFHNGWRVFAKDSDLPLNELPRKTSLQRAYADWLIAGNKAGDGFGVFIFDGEKILK